METKVADVIVPEEFYDYVIQGTVEKNAFIKSGIAAPVDGVDITRGGRTVHIPMWEDLDDYDEVLDDNVGLTVNKVKGLEDIAAIHARGWALGRNDLATILAGDDPLRVIYDRFSEKWSKIFTKILIASLNGAINSTTTPDSVLDKSGTELTADMMTEGSFLLGDNFDKISAVAFNSRVLAKLKKLDLIDTVQPSTVEPGYMTYMRKRVIVDDSLKGIGKDYPIYFFGKGAVAYNENKNLATVESDRDIIEGTDVVVSRRVFTMHPRGIKWTGTPAGKFPSQDELADPTNWELVDNYKNVPITKLVAQVS